MIANFTNPFLSSSNLLVVHCSAVFVCILVGDCIVSSVVEALYFRQLSIYVSGDRLDYCGLSMRVMISVAGTVLRDSKGGWNGVVIV